MAEARPTIHASAVLVGARAVLIRGPSGAGKSQLALALLAAGNAGAAPFARLVADDRVVLSVHHDRLLASPPEPLAGLIEVRGLGICRVPHESIAMIGLVIDLGEGHAPRLPADADRRVLLEGIPLPRLAVPPGSDPLKLVLARTGFTGLRPVRE